MAQAPAVPGSGSADFSIGAIMAPLVAIIVGIFMVILDATAVNVALPSLVRDFHSSVSTLQWTITGYTLAQAAVIPLAGWLSDRFGAKRTFLISITLFTLGSVLCATAPTSGVLIAFRILQGIGGGSVLPVAMAYVYRLSPPERVGAVMGMMGIPILLAPAVGPVLAGWLVQFASWRWIFLLNLPIGIIGVLIGLRTLPAMEGESKSLLDIPGSILGPLAFAALTYGISQGSSGWTSAQTIGGIVVGVIALVLFSIVELRTRQPLLELRVFRSVDFSWAIVVQWIGQFALFGAIFLVPLFLQQARGFGAFDTGLVLLPQAIASAVFMPIGGALFDRIGARPLIVVGLGLVSVATVILGTVSPHTGGVDLILPLMLSGAGMGLMLMPLNTHILNAAPRALVGRVTSLTAALQQVISSLAVALLATVLTSRSTVHINAVKQQFHIKGAITSGTGTSSAAAHIPAPIAAALNRAFTLAFDDAFHLMLVVAIVGAVMGLAVRRIATTATETGAEGEAGAAQPMVVV